MEQPLAGMDHVQCQAMPCRLPPLLGLCHCQQPCCQPLAVHVCYRVIVSVVRLSLDREFGQRVHQEKERGSHICCVKHPVLESIH